MRQVSETPTITAGAYSALDAVGGKLEFENVCTPYKNTGTIIQAHIHDKAKQNALLYLVLFSEDFTATADNAAFDVTDADLLHVVGTIEFPVASYRSFNDNSFVEADTILDFELIEGGTSLFGQLYVVTSTPTYAATTDLTVSLVVD